MFRRDVKKLFILLLLIPMVSFGETWICQAESDPQHEKETYVRHKDTLTWMEFDTFVFKISEENENFIIATSSGFHSPVNPESSVLILDKRTRRQSVAVTNQTDTASFQGDCQVIGQYE